MITPEQGVVIGQRYVLTRHLAQGGMGSVWIARHRDLDVDVTIKFMAPSLIASPDARTRFEREARVAARLDSQYVVHVHDYGVEDGTPYLVMELLKGESLWTRLARDGMLSLPAAARLLLQMCKALRTAHEAGLVHRDLKPGNIFLARKDEDEVVKILDFGIAKTTDLGDAQASTESGVLLGSVHYMSPEQIRSSRAVDHRSDLWSIGVILYRVLGGRLPFPGEKLGDVLVRVCTDPFPPLSSVVADLPIGIDDFIARALDRDPDKRFQSAVEMAAAFSAMALEATAPSISLREPSARPVLPSLPSTTMPSMAAPTTASIPAPALLSTPSPIAAPSFTHAPFAPPSLRPEHWDVTVPLGQLGRPDFVLDRSDGDSGMQMVPVTAPATHAAETSTFKEPSTHDGLPVDMSRRISLPGGETLPLARAWWPVGVLAAVVALAAILGLALRSGEKSGDASAVATGTARISPPAADILAPVSNAVPETTASAAPAPVDMAPSASGPALRKAPEAPTARPLAPPKSSTSKKHEGLW